MLTRCLPSSGRIVAAQFSVLMTFPCTLIIYKLLPVTAAGGMSTMMAPYACVFFVTGCLISWWAAIPPFSEPAWPSNHETAELLCSLVVIRQRVGFLHVQKY